jgi:hypothetical protein
MQALLEALIVLLPPGAPRASPSRPWAHRPFWLGLEALEDRSVPATSVLGVPVPDLTMPSDFGLPPLTSVPVTAELHPPSPLSQALGDQLSLSLPLPVPPFLTPAGTATLATQQTGWMTVTNLAVDNDRLNQLAGSIRLPDGTPLTFSAPGQVDGVASTRTRDVMHLAFAPLSLDVLGARVEASHVELTASFEHGPGNPLSGGQGGSPLTAILQTVGQVASAFGNALRAIGAFVPTLHLPPSLGQALQGLTPPIPSTTLLSHFRLNSINFDFSGLFLSVSSFVVDAFADTGPGKVLGNLFAEVDKHGGNFEGMGALMGHILNGMPIPNMATADLRKAAMAKATTPTADDPAAATPTHPGKKSRAGTSSSTGSGGSQDSSSKPKVSRVIPVPEPRRPAPPGNPVIASLPPDMGGGTKPQDTPPPPKQAKEKSENDDPLSDDDSPLPSVLPEIGLPEESGQPVAQNGTGFDGLDGTGDLSGKLEQQTNKVGRQILSMTVIPAGGLFARLLSLLDDITDPDNGLCWLRPTSPTVVTEVVIPPQHRSHPWYGNPVIGHACDNGSGIERERLCHKTTPTSVDEFSDNPFWGCITWPVSPRFLGVLASGVLPALYVKRGKDELDPRTFPRIACDQKGV